MRGTGCASDKKGVGTRLGTNPVGEGRLAQIAFNRKGAGGTRPNGSAVPIADPRSDPLNRLSSVRGEHHHDRPALSTDNMTP